MNALELLASALTKLRTEIQITGLVILVAGIVAVRELAPGQLHAQISAGAIGVTFIVFGQCFRYLDKIPGGQRAGFILVLFLAFLVFVLALVNLTSKLIESSPPSSKQMPPT